MKKYLKIVAVAFILLCNCLISAQTNSKIYDIIDAVSAQRIKQDDKTLIDFDMASVDNNGFESPVVFPNQILRD